MILITEYDKRWPQIYQCEKDKIIAAIGAQIVAIEHIGSTAVSGLASKPVIDIMVAVENFKINEQLINSLQQIGYSYVPEYEINIPNRRFYHRGPSETTGQPNKHFHLHVAEIGSSFWREHLKFRDYLRTHHEACLAYAGLKKRLAKESQGDIQYYCNGKSGFINNIILS